MLLDIIITLIELQPVSLLNLDLDLAPTTKFPSLIWYKNIHLDNQDQILET